jgi:hypothetical protein
MNKELTREEARLAWAHGQRVEACPRVKDGPWLPVKPHSSFAGQWSVDVLLDLSFKFRLASEPTAKKFRPWTQEEVPVGALIRFKDWSDGCRLMICGAWNGGVMWATAEGVAIKPPERLLNESWEHSTDNGKTWHRCGVEVEL